MKKVFVAVADHRYINYAQALFASAKLNGEWDGDFVLIVPEKEKELSEVSILEEKGIEIYYGKTLPGNPTVHFYKIYLLDEYFKHWDWIFYCDIDVLFFNKIKLDLIKRNKSILFANPDALSFMKHFFGSKIGYPNEVFDKWSEKKKHKSVALLNYVNQKYDDGEALQTCFMLFNKKLINDGYFKRIYDCYLKYHYKHLLTKPGLWDQTLFNLVFYKKWKPLGDKFMNKNPLMDQIGWDKEILKNGYYDDNDYTGKTALHFFNFFPPWDENNLKFYPIWEKSMADGIDDNKKNMILNPYFIKKSITNNGEEGEVIFAWSHGSTNYHIGDGIIIYSLIYYLRLKTCVCLGTGGGFIPRIMTQARLDLVKDGTFTYDKGITIVVDDMSERWGETDWESKDSFFRQNFRPTVIMETSENAYFSYFIKHGIKIDYLHIDANHNYPFVKKDFELYSKILSKNGIITMHDTDIDYANNIWGKDNYEKEYFNFTGGPTKVVKEITKGGEFEVLNLSNSDIVKRDKNSTGITILKRKKNK